MLSGDVFLMLETVDNKEDTRREPGQLHDAQFEVDVEVRAASHNEDISIAMICCRLKRVQYSWEQAPSPSGSGVKSIVDSHSAAPTAEEIHALCMRKLISKYYDVSVVFRWENSR